MDIIEAVLYLASELVSKAFLTLEGPSHQKSKIYLAFWRIAVIDL
jgi:hypothetical protein